jgi:hypothetical protein
MSHQVIVPNPGDAPDDMIQWAFPSKCLVPGDWHVRAYSRPAGALST